MSTKPAFHFNVTTPLPVRAALNRAYRDGLHVRLFLGDAATGRDWCEENDVTGYIGRSTGTQPIALLIEKLRPGPFGITRARGGGAVLTDCILKIVCIDTGDVLYCNKLYAVPEFTLCKREDPKYPWFVTHDSKEFAAFSHAHEAYEYIAFIQGSKLARAPRTHEEYEADFLEAA